MAGCRHRPERSVRVLQSAVPQISELHTLLSMIVPVSWLQRVPTYKDQLERLGPEIATYGFSRLSAAAVVRYRGLRR